MGGLGSDCSGSEISSSGGVLAGWHQRLLKNLALLDPAECASVDASVHALREHWVQRHPVVPFFTLGASNYFDIAHIPEPPYYRIAKALNPLLREHFGWLYERLAARIAEAFRVPCVYTARLALPGFHVFQAHPALEQPVGLMHQEWFARRYEPATFSSPIHCDTPHLIVDWSDMRVVDRRHPISFTLAITLPHAGAGMYVWDVGIEHSLRVPEWVTRRVLDQSPPREHAYREGALALHSGLMFHQVAPLRDLRPDDTRITLQGHGLPCDGAIQLYW